ncbi:hypothetical protein [Aequorivita capsosiphonis]|nr:hypothetical protein [Aequorivita capsosiphonis]
MNTTNDNPLKKREQEPHRVPNHNEKPEKKEPGKKDQNPIGEPKTDRPL